MENSQPSGKIDQWVSRYFWGLLFFILVIGFLFRLPGLSERSLWIDELYSEWFSSLSLKELWTEVPQYETHPPMYYTLLKLWTYAFGNSELGLRSLSLVASLATIFTVGISSRVLKLGSVGNRVSLFAALLLALNYANIRQAQNARPYCLQTFIVSVIILASLVLVARLVRTDAKNNSALGAAIVLGLASGFSIWLHNTGLFIAMGIWAGLAATLPFLSRHRRRAAFGIFLACGVLALAVWAPYVPIFLAQSKAFAGLSFWIKPRLQDSYDAWGLALGGEPYAIILTLMLIALGLFALFRKRPQMAVQLLAIMLLPLYAIVAISYTIKPIYITRLFEWLTPVSLLMISTGAMVALRPNWLKISLSGALILISVGHTVSDIGRPSEDWKGVVAAIAESAQPGDVVIALPAQGKLAIEYYASRHPDFPDRVYVPGPYPMRHLPRIYVSNLGGPKLIEADGALVDKALATHKRVWLIEIAVHLYDPTGIVSSRIKAKRKFVRAYGNQLVKVQLFE